MSPPETTTPAGIDGPGHAPIGEAGIRYLLAEFDAAWRHLGGLEEKRLKLFLGYCLVATIVLAAAMHATSPRPAALVAMAADLRGLAGLWLLLLSLAFRYIALSERKATERYRSKINLLRRTLLETLSSGALNEMQRQGNDWALQIAPTRSKALQVMDLLDRRQWTTALFMKLTYDLGALLGLALLFVWLRG